MKELQEQVQYIAKPHKHIILHYKNVIIIFIA